MKKKKFFAIIVIFSCMFLLAVPAITAEARGSSQINMYSMTVTPVTDTLNIRFSVNGNGPVDKLGCESIYVYEKSGSKWVLEESWDEDDDGMSRSNYYVHKNTMYYYSNAGTEYKVVVTIFAENSKGRDTRTDTFYVTGR